jgi:GntR family transcriptional repressor for pyruvate dehydrogenase complex
MADDLKAAAPGAAPSTERSRRVRPQRAAELVASDIRTRILTGEYVDGLPKESVLLEEYQVSRPTVREGLRILETEGLVETRRGRQGGAVVRRPTPASAAYHLGLSLQAAGADIKDLAAARQLLEPLCASLAAQRPDCKEVAARLDALNDEGEALIGQGAAFTASLLRFHAELVEASESVTLRILVGTIETIWQGQERAWAERVSADGGYPNDEDQTQALASHRRITKLIGKGDAEGAMVAARKHLAASMTYVDGDAERAVGGIGERVIDASPLRV